MLPKALIKNYDQRRLRNLLIVFFFALAVPTTVVIWQAYSQLKWEAYYQYRSQAEALTNRINSSLASMVADIDARSLTDFSFLNVAQTGKVLQRSPLAEFPVSGDLPGVIGYFQVDQNGTFSTPLLPDTGNSYVEAGIDAAEFSQRSILAAQIQQVLAANKLVRNINPAKASPDNAPADKPTDTQESSRARSGDKTRSLYAGSDESAFNDVARDIVESEEPRLEEDADVASYSQEIFVELNQAKLTTPAESRIDQPAPAAQKRENNRGLISDLGLNEVFERKTDALEKKSPQTAPAKLNSPAARRPRQEQVALPQTAQQQSQDVVDELSTEPILNEELIINTFAGNIDPYEFSLLGSGHSVVFRQVWRDNERFVQGLLLNQEKFTEGVISAAFRDTTLAEMTELVVGYNDEVIRVISGTGQREDYLASSGGLEGTLLYRGAISAPFDSLALIFSIRKLPRGAGANVLTWSTIVIAVVFLAGFLALYRLGLSQIRLARQQQDFVSAVSHELKTPLTSIRMYGEMLKEGWADETKRKQYYEYIHDESERLTRLITNVLQLANITRNDSEIDLRLTSVAELMSGIESKISSQVERAGFELQLQRAQETDGIEIEVDSDGFSQIIINLVDNAIKFSRDADKKIIDISTHLSANGEVTFSVRDFGPGIRSDQMKKIFQMFYRTESELTRETVGTGIGLAIVHQLVTAMNGRIDVTNQDPGAKFGVIFDTV